ncbi:MAG: PQQ-dependent sugar dehydrogenase [Acidobacteria bacterium]|nr:PQQ-dependent sugar dehydrogenase [Acidobacteriota bacterium]
MSKSKLGAFCVLALLCAAGLAVRHTRATHEVSAALSSDISGPEGTLTIQTQPVLTTGLTSPVFVTNARDGSNRLFIIQQGGIIKILQPGATTTTDFLNITSSVISGGERGLLGLAFHPQYTSNRRFFVYYTRTGDAAIQIAEYKVSTANPNVADTAETRIISVPHPTNSNHNGGTVLFGPDGYLYFGPGDGGSANDPPNNAQNINQLLGKINRIDINVTPGGATNYAIPPTNPFAGATPGADEIYMVGMRNPYRFSFDRQTGELWIGDVGQGAREEIDIGQLGGNFGWRTYEGTACTGLNPTECVPSNFVFPVAEYTHTGGRCSLTGGYRYRGRRGTFPQGAYIYGDYCTGEIFMLQGTTQTLLLDTPLAISSFGEDEYGEIYVVNLNGGLYKLVNPNAAVPRNVVDDFDGDLKSDIGVFRPSTGVWYIRQSFTNSLQAFQFGQSGDTITPGDYDGDGKTDAAVWRNGVFYVLRSSDNTVLTQAWGQAGDDARVVADYDGDKKTDFAVFRKTTTAGDPAVWYIRLSMTGGMRAVQWGITGDAGVTGDYDGDGTSDVTVYRPSTNSFYVQRSRDNSLFTQQWGISSSDKIVPGDYDGDGQTDFAVFRTTNGVWYVLQSSNGQVRAQLFGVTGDEPVPGDYDADGKTDFAVVRNNSGNLTWYLSQSATNNVFSQQWGVSSDYIVPTFQTR